MNIGEAIKWGRSILSEKEVEGPRASAEFLLRTALGKDKVFVISHPEFEIKKLDELKYRRFIKRRSRHEPVWYITGKIEFMGLDLAVNQSVLIPRPETELMVEMITETVQGGGFSPKTILDVGTGSGTIILSLSNKLGIDHRYFASDISIEALKTAQKNFLSSGLSANITFKNGDLLSPWSGSSFDLVVANLPYVPHEDMATLAFDLTHYEPRVALDGGILGLEVYKKFIEELPGYLNPGARVFMEIGYDQGRYIEDFVHRYMPKAKVKTLGDYQQIDRIVVIET